MAKKTKSVAKPAEVKPAEAVAEPVVEAAPAAVVAETVTEAPAEVKAEKKTPAKKTAKVSEDKAPAKKAPAAKKEAAVKKGEPKKAESIEIQFGGASFEPGDIIERCKAAYKGNSRKQIKTIAVYVNMDERKAYYVVNGKEEGAFITL